MRPTLKPAGRARTGDSIRRGALLNRPHRAATVFAFAVIFLACVFEGTARTAGRAGGKETVAATRFTTAQAPSPRAGRPKTVREFFLLLPQDYFGVECCGGSLREYLKKYLVVEDTANGYLEGGGDGAQPGFKMALFKRPDGSYLIGLETFGEGLDDNYFLEYRNGKWLDVAARDVPRYSRKNFYVIPRYGTTIEVFDRVFPESESPEFSEKGRKKLYDLLWKNGNFTVRQ